MKTLVVFFDLLTFRKKPGVPGRPRFNLVRDTSLTHMLLTYTCCHFSYSQELVQSCLSAACMKRQMQFVHCHHWELPICISRFTATTFQILGHIRAICVLARIINRWREICTQDPADLANPALVCSVGSVVSSFSGLALRLSCQLA